MINALGTLGFKHLETDLVIFFFGVWFCVSWEKKQTNLSLSLSLSIPMLFDTVIKNSISCVWGEGGDAAPGNETQSFFSFLAPSIQRELEYIGNAKKHQSHPNTLTRTFEKTFRRGEASKKKEREKKKEI